ncbi:hypothetical protein F441_10679 [Phytophthora nicotianae CJ01A1]|uniref:Uncharacterized protein n=4 Tax=Phytophthora nicotianae TaxID=4792 RepID=V9F0E3_PHYNI|nr:hypothetical protein F443_10746 [Phytophthora nicotianae P1569]ETO73200.1 hypothetical protein F444_10837 [Phytophthora nicotianae P1976]ETP14376.1 hypothetical protein F441_10679 [Phytophthora nicotianae CJ01A1]ETP42425.1 hypothetical protein F442_10648 [Phytophthora nicotianae P10297]
MATDVSVRKSVPTKNSMHIKKLTADNNGSFASRSCEHCTLHCEAP